MADTKIKDLPTITGGSNLADGDLIPLHDASAVATKHVSVPDLTEYHHEYGEIYTAKGNTGGVTTAADPEKITQFTVNGSSTTNITPDHTNDNITVNRAGTYKISWSCSFSGTGSTQFQFAAYKDATVIPNTVRYRKLGTGGDVGGVSNGSSITTLTAGQVITLYVSATVGTSFTMWAGHLSVERIGD